ncbi:MAG TPA: gliding motility-associated C-terminal domain-containing protein [Chitinophagales bacterium]|nr:gliding motility-associated C-terminal domain-containing protein [Chitinophagales bacterium]
MQRKNCLLLLLLLTQVTCQIHAQQSVRSVGHDFWISLGGDQGFYYLTDVRLKVTAIEDAAIEVHYTTNGSVVNYNMLAGDLKTISLNQIPASPVQAEVIENKSVHIISSGAISMYLLSPNGSTDDATLILPADQPNYGTIFYPISYKVQPLSVSPVDFTIVSSCDSTVLEITPSQLSAGNHPAGVPYNIVLNEGDTYECGTSWASVNYEKDITGWKVEVLSGACCNPINIYEVALPWYIYPDTTTLGFACCADNWVEVIYPQQSWDTAYYFVPFKYPPYDIIRILSATNANNIYFDGVLTGTINSGGFLEGSVDTAVKITADAPVEIMQMMVSQYADPSGMYQGDPALLTVSSFKDHIQKTKFSTSYPFGGNPFNHIVNVIIHSSDTDLILLNGTPITENFHRFNTDQNMAYSRVDLDTGVTYLLECNCDFLASLYGEYTFGSYATQLPAFHLQNPEPPLVHETDTLCGVPAVLYALQGTSYLWNDGTTDSTFIALDTGMYYVYVLLNDCEDTFQFFYVSEALIDSAALPLDTLFSCGEPLTITAPSGGQSYLWSNGDTTQSTDVDSAGIFAVVTQFSLCEKHYDWYVVVPFIDTASTFSSDTFYYCKSAFQLNAPLGLSYQWSTGDTTATITVNGTGEYIVIVNSAYCIYDTVQFVVSAFPLLVQPFTLGSDTVFCYGDEVILTGPSINTEWSTGETGLEIIVKEDGEYIASITDSCTGEIFSDTIGASRKVCFCDPLFPDAFTPNNDGINDDFHSLHALDCNYSDYLFRVFNRWGQLLFETNDPNGSWNGTLSGAPQPMSVYAYLCRYELADSPSPILLKGNVTLIR